MAAGSSAVAAVARGVGGYRKLIVKAVMFVAPALARWGFQVDANLIADALIVGAPAVMALMRAITRTPLGSKANA